MQKNAQEMEHMYTDEELKWYISKYNEILRYLSVTWEFDVDDKITNIERWLVKIWWWEVYWDYLDFIHASIKWDLVDLEEYDKMLHCIKFTLESWKTFVLSEEDRQNLPSWIHCLGEYIKDLSAAKSWDKTYLDIVQNILHDIASHECEHFSSPEYQKQKQEVWGRILKVLKAKKSW